MLNPSLALASGILREIWDKKAMSLEDMALEINDQVGESVCDRDSLSRFLWAGTDINRGLRRPAAFNKMLVLLSDYFGVDRQDLKKKMDAEALRQRFIADLGLADASIKNLIAALKARPDVSDKQAKKIEKWLQGRAIDKELYRLLPDAVAALEFVTGNEYTDNDLIEFKKLISDLED